MAARLEPAGQGLSFLQGFLLGRERAGAAVKRQIIPMMTAARVGVGEHDRYTEKHILKP